MKFIFYKKNVYIKYLLYIINKISGSSIEYLLDHVDFIVPKDIKLDKGWLGRLLEFYINSNISGNLFCDIPLLNLEIKTFSSNIFGFPNNDIFLMSLKLSNFFKLINIENIFFKKIKNILWIPIIGNKNTFFLYKIIGNFFISFFKRKDFDYFLIQLNEMSDFFFNNNIIFYNFYTDCFRFQLLPNNSIKKYLINFDKYNLRIYFRKKIVKNFIIKNKIFI